MPTAVLPSAPTLAGPANNVVPFTRPPLGVTPPPPSAAAGVPAVAAGVPAGAAAAGTGSAIGLGPMAIGGALGAAAALAGASGLSGVPPGDILDQARREIPGQDPNRDYDPARFGLPTLPDLSGQPIPPRNPDGSRNPGGRPKTGIPQRNTPQQPRFPFTGGQVPGRNYIVSYSYTIPGTALNGGGSPVLTGPIGGVVTSTGGGLINYAIQHGGGLRPVVSAAVEQPAVVVINGVTPVDGLADSPENPPAAFVPSPVFFPGSPPEPVKPADPEAPPSPAKEPQPKKVPPPFSEPVPFRRPSRPAPTPPDPATPDEPQTPEPEPERKVPPPMPETPRPGTEPDSPATPNPGTAPVGPFRLQSVIQ